MIWSQIKQKIGQQIRGAIAIVPLTAGLVIASNFTGIYQTLEWSTLDMWFRLRSREAREERIVVVDITESDIAELGEWPMSDGVLAELLAQISRQQPRGIGLDLYRDLKHGDREGQQQLEKVFQSTPNLIGVEKSIGETVKPSPILEEEDRVGMADLVLDRDGKVRRALISTKSNNGEITLGLATRLALIYLEKEAISLAEGDKPGTLRLGKSLLSPIGKNAGAYVNADAGGYQLLLNFRGEQQQFLQTTLSEVLNNSIPQDLFRDRLVLLGTTATSLNDLFYTPYSSATSHYLPGVYIHANIASQMISGAIDGRLMLRGISEPGKWFWILGWSIAGTGISLILLEKNLLQQSSFSSFQVLALGTSIPIVILFSSSYLLFLNGWWLPTITPLLAFGIATAMGALYHNQNQKRIAFTDGLTGIANRRFFDRYLEQEWTKCQREKKDISLILGDVDFFKVYNDTYGHQEGDICLQKVALAMSSAVRKSDLAARYGGEEFVVVLPNTNPKMALIVADRIRAKLSSMEIPHKNSKASDRVSISMGIASVYHNRIVSIEELIAAADAALYRAKEAGRDRAVINDES